MWTLEGQIRKGEYFDSILYSGEKTLDISAKQLRNAFYLCGGHYDSHIIYIVVFYRYWLLHPGEDPNRYPKVLKIAIPDIYTINSCWYQISDTDTFSQKRNFSVLCSKCKKNPTYQVLILKLAPQFFNVRKGNTKRLQKRFYTHQYTKKFVFSCHTVTHCIDLRQSPPMLIQITWVSD